MTRMLRHERTSSARSAAEPTSFATMLTGGHPNSLGRTQEVVDIVAADRARLEELFAAIDDPDEVVRLRVGDALEKVCRERPEWFVPFVERILGELGPLTQPSVRWHVAQMLHHLRGALDPVQRQRATALLQHNLVDSTDWIVLNVTVDVLTEWAGGDPALATWLRPRLEELTLDRRPSVAKRATMRLAELTSSDGGHPA